MKRDDFEEACYFLLKDYEPEAANEIVSCLTDTTLDTTAPEALTPNVIGGGGRAFLWRDVIGFSDLLGLGFAVDTANELDISHVLDTPEATKLILTLLKSWHRFRKTSVSLDKNEFKVLRAIQKGKDKVEGIAEYTELPTEAIHEALKLLREKKYREEIPLVEQEGSTLSTKF